MFPRGNRVVRNLQKKAKTRVGYRLKKLILVTLRCFQSATITNT